MLNRFFPFPFASLLLSVFALNCIAFAFAFSAPSSLTSAATAQNRRRGGHKGAIRGVRAILAASAELPADIKCQFSGFSRASRPPFQRIKCNLCNKNRDWFLLSLDF